MSSSEELIKGFEGLTNEQSIEYQTKQWVKGFSLHNPVRDECCPDFSCCMKGFQWNSETREAFYKAIELGDEETRSKMLFGSLGKLVAETTNKKVHLISDNTQTTDV